VAYAFRASADVEVESPNSAKGFVGPMRALGATDVYMELTPPPPTLIGGVESRPI
jgi:hypothetical protein